MSAFAGEMRAVGGTEALSIEGRVAELRGLTVLVDDLPAALGSLVSIRTAGLRPAPGEVVGFAGSRSIVMTLGQSLGVRPGDSVIVDQREQVVRVSEEMVGRVVNGLGRPIDGGAALRGGSSRPLSPEPCGALSRARVDRPIRTGVRAIDLMTPLGKGQRLGIFAGPGVGKSTLLSQIARGTDADINVIALIGERGREVREFLEEALGPEGLARSVVVVSTSDESPLMRLRASRLACSIAEYHRDAGRDVMLMMDSVTRFAHAQRQVGLSAGEPPATRGYTPSVFANMAVLLERAGASEGGGSITGLYTILVEGDDMTEPIADAARGILDGHLILSRRLAHRGQFPAIDVLDSVSRVAEQVSDELHMKCRRRLLRLEAQYHEVEELLQVGAYTRGVNAETDVAVDRHADIARLLAQSVRERVGFDEARAAIVRLAGEIEVDLATIAGAGPQQARRAA